MHPRGEVIRSLHENPELMAKLEQLEDQVNERIQFPGASVRLDLLELISEALPVEALLDHDAAANLVDKVLDRSGDRLDSLIDSGPANPEESLEIALADIGRRFFKAQIEDLTAKEQESLPEGRPGDEKVQDDLTSMLEEYEKLPDGDHLMLRLDDELYVRETAGVCLFQMVENDDEELVAKAWSLLAALIENRPEIADLLVPYVELCVSEKGLTKEYENYWTVVDFIQKAGLDALLAGRDFLRPEVVATTFPHQFIPFLDSLSPTSKHDADKLIEVCRAIGRKRLKSESEFLVDRKGLITRDRVRMVLSVDSDQVLPLVQMIVTHGPEWVRSPVAKFVYGRNTPTKEAAALLAVRPLSDLDPEYLATLCEPYLGRRQRVWLWDRSSYLLRRYLSRTAEGDEPIKRRINAIDMLTLLPSKENAEALRKVTKEGGLLTLDADRRMVRKAAKEALRTMQRQLQSDKND